MPNEIRDLPLMEQAFIIQCIIEEMETDVEMAKEMKGRNPQMSLKQLIGQKGKGR